MIDREQIAETLYKIRFPHRTWKAASYVEVDIAYRQAEEIIALIASGGEK